MIRRLSRALALVFVLFACLDVAPFPAVDRRFEGLAQRYVQGLWAFSPSWATTWGRHEYDRQLGDRSPAAIRREIERARKTLADLGRVRRASLSEANRIDFDLMEHAVRGHLFDLTEVRRWETDPSSYEYGEAVFSIMARTYAPPEERLRAVIARLRQVPALYEAARKNLRNPPAVFTGFAVEECEGMVSFLETEVPMAFGAVTDSALWREYRAAAGAAGEATRAYARWLTESMLPRSGGSFVLGEERYRKKLLYDEMVDLPVDTLLAIGQRELDRLTTRYQAAARRIDPAATVEELVARMGSDHPPADSLIPYAEGLLEDIRAFSIRSGFCGVPSEVRCLVRPTPEFAAGRSFASLEAPGPFETKAAEAFFNITLPSATWPAERIEQHLRGYSRWSLPSVSIHEAYPGHYVHFLHGKNAPTFVRKSMGSGAFSEGWALYTEEGMLDRGYGGGDPRIEFGVMRWALVRACRFQVGLRVHTRGMPMEQAIQFFVDRAGMERANAEREAYRAAFDPTYIVYTLGALQIRKLRDDVARTEGAAFDLARFHAAILSQGSLPVPLLRRVLLHDDGPSL
jgi:uncharacterized protein (DUF885 family)